MVQICKSLNTSHKHLLKEVYIKQKSHNTISAEKTFDEVQYLSMIKSNKETKIRRNRAQTIKVIGNKPISFYTYTFS